MRCELFVQEFNFVNFKVVIFMKIKECVVGKNSFSDLRFVFFQCCFNISIGYIVVVIVLGMVDVIDDVSDFKVSKLRNVGYLLVVGGIVDDNRLFYIVVDNIGQLVLVFGYIISICKRRYYVLQAIVIIYMVICVKILV